MKKFFAFVLFLFITGCTLFNPTRIVWIQNDNNESIYVKIEGLENASQQKLVFIQHGLASNMNHAVVQTAKKAFLDNDFVVVSFDSRYSLGKGSNDVEKVSLATFEQDLQSVIKWAQTQSFYSEPFAIVGHSMGGASVIEFGAKHPDLVDVLVPVAPVISGKLWEKSCMENMTDFCHQWQRKGTYEYTDPENHKTAIIPFGVIATCNNYDANKLAKQITAKTLLIGAQNDIVINPNDVLDLSKKIKSVRAVIIKSADHNFTDKENQSDLYQTIDVFLKQKEF